MQETLYLLSSPKNAGRLVRSVAQINARKGTPRTLLTDEQTESPKQGDREV
jgi:antitoxin YefM